MSDAVYQVLLDRWRVDRSRQALSDLLEACEPLVRSICRRHFRDGHEVDDAVQETLARVAERIGSVQGDFTAWVCRVARSVCVDQIRREARLRARQRQAALQPPPDNGVLTWEAARARLDDALADLDPATRRLVVDRFLHGRRLRELAPEHHISIPQMSRRIAQVIDELADIYRRLGFDTDADGLQDALYGGGFRGSGCGCHAPPPDHGLLVAPAWPRVVTGPPPSPAHRPIRIGVVVSHYATGIRHPLTFWRMTPETQLFGTHLFDDPRHELVAVVEPDTAHLGHIERAVRDHDLTAGLIDATDTDGLRTLDVIWIGWQAHLHPPVTAAIRVAVSEGVGLYNQGLFRFMHDPPGDPLAVRRGAAGQNALVLMRRSFGSYCTFPDHGVHHAPLPSIVRRAHPALPGLAAGTQLKVDHCAWLYEPTEDAEVLIESEQRLAPNCDCQQCLQHTVGQLREPRPMPLVVAGSIGRGRVFTVNPVYPRTLHHHPSLTGRYLDGVMDWLSGPRREG